jgi:transposase
MSQPQWWIGIDLSSKEHEWCLVNIEGKVKRQGRLDHNPQGMAKLARVVDDISQDQPRTVAAAVETPRGTVVEVLLDRGVQVYSINPKQLDRFRDRHTVAGAKDDRLDAFVLADSLRTDTHLFHLVEPLPEENYCLRELSRTLEELEHIHRQQANRLWSLLSRYFPVLLRFCSGADEPWLWNLLKKAGTPQAAARLHVHQVRLILKPFRIQRFSADELVQAFNEPGILPDPVTSKVCNQHVQILVQQLILFQKQIKQCTADIKAALKRSATPQEDQNPSDTDIVLSMVGIGWKTGAVLLSEASQAIRNADYRTLRGQSGVAPVTRSSGKKTVTLMRRACDHRLRKALHHAAGVAVMHVTPWHHIYSRIRGKGGSHARALRQVADRMLYVLTTMLQERTLFDIQRMNS